MHKIEFPDIGIVKEIPSCFDEMTQEDFIRFSHLYLQFQKGSIDYARLKTEMVFQFLGIRHNKWRYELLDDEARSKISVNVFLISGKLDFFFKEEKRDGKVNLKVNFPWTKNLVPAYHGYIGPADALADVSFLEYKNAHVASVEYIKSQDDVDLNWLVAILYRKPLLWFMKKPAYDEYKTRKIADKIFSWPFHHPVKYAIFLNFLAFEEYIRTGAFTIDGQEISFRILFNEVSDDDGAEKTDTGLTGLLFNLAESGVFGNVKETSEQKLYDVLFRLYQVRKEYLAMKRNMERKK